MCNVKLGDSRANVQTKFENRHNKSVHMQCNCKGNHCVCCEMWGRTCECVEASSSTMTAIGNLSSYSAIA